MSYIIQPHLPVLYAAGCKVDFFIKAIHESPGGELPETARFITFTM